MTLGLAFRTALRIELLRDGEPADAEPMLWAADRGADRLVALDQELHVLRSLQVGAPCEVEAVGDGSLWVLRSWTRSARGPDEIVLLGRDARALVRSTLDRAFDLVALPDQRAAVLGCRTKGELGARLIVLSFDGSTVELGERTDLVALAACGEHLLAGSANGELRLWNAREVHEPARESMLPAPLEDLAMGPRPGTWWALCRESGGARLILLDSALQPSWERILGPVSGPLVSVPGEQRVWLTVSDEACCLALGSAGVLECFRSELPALPSGAGAPRPEGGVFLAAAGAILALDEAGISRPGQAGFEDLTDLALATE